MQDPEIIKGNLDRLIGETWNRLCEFSDATNIPMDEVCHAALSRLELLWSDYCLASSVAHNNIKRAYGSDETETDATDDGGMD